MKTIAFLYEFIGREMILGTLYSIIPSIGLGIILFVTGFPLGLMIGATLGAINGTILATLCLLFINRLKNQRIIRYIFIIVSVIVTLVCVYILIYWVSLYYTHRTNMLNVPEIRSTPNYSGLHDMSTKFSIPMALIAGFASSHLSNWYLEYRNKENATQKSV